MHYRPWLEQRVERFRDFFADESPGQILVTLALWDMGIDYADYGVPGRPLSAWHLVTELDAFAEHRIRQLRVAIDLHREVDDDWVPFVNPSYGIALNSVYYSGADVIPGEATTWVHPVLRDWSDLEKLKLDPENVWFRRISELNRRYVAMSDGDYTVQTFSHFAPMDMANALRGNALFTDFYDAPEQVHGLMIHCVDAILWLERAQRQIVGDVMGGTVIWGTWMPGPVIFMSEDATDLCSAATYVEFARPYTEAISREIGGCYIHHHARGYHVHRAIAAVEGLRQLQISRDPNCGPPVEHIEDLYAWNGDIPLMTHCHVRDVYEHIDAMKGGRLILQLTADDLDQARDAIAFIRDQTA
jgi:hypothetical protein